MNYPQNIFLILLPSFLLFFTKIHLYLLTDKILQKESVQVVLKLTNKKRQKKLHIINYIHTCIS